MARLRKYAARTAEFDALFAEVDETIKERNEASPALELGPVIGIGEVKLLWFHVALRSEELNENDVCWIQGDIRVDSRNTNWFSVSVSTVEPRARGRGTYFSNDGALHDDLQFGRCEPDSLPRWLASTATRLSITWRPFLPTSNLRSKRLARVADWLASR